LPHLHDRCFLFMSLQTTTPENFGDRAGGDTS
jgi:hypothetical protein